MIISISGTPGSGKSTVGKALAKRLDLKRYYIGGILREQAKRRGMTIQELLKKGETDPSIDKDIDEYQRSLGETENNFLIEGRTSFIMIPHSIKIYLKVDAHTAAERIYNDTQERNEGESRDIEDVADKIRERMESDKKRYLQYYGTDAFDENNYDIVIDTTSLSPEEVIEEIIRRLEKLRSSP
ncbi:MAG: cytidylate kinase family protein [Candidatus Woesearchaeota archaeon]